MLIPDPGPSPEARCVVCGHPLADHAHPRYSIRAWLSHKLLDLADKISGVRP